MSRIVLDAKKKDHVVNLGLDHAMGWFFQLYGPTFEDGEENLLIDKSSIFSSQFRKDSMLALITEHAEPGPRATHCTCMIAMDLDPVVGLPPRE